MNRRLLDETLLASKEYPLLFMPLQQKRELIDPYQEYGLDRTSLPELIAIIRELRVSKDGAANIIARFVADPLQLGIILPPMVVKLSLIVLGLLILIYFLSALAGGDAGFPSITGVGRSPHTALPGAHHLSSVGTANTFACAPEVGCSLGSRSTRHRITADGGQAL
jgi:hypothetical protein